MLKYAALLFNTIALLMYQFFFADGITVSQNIPSSAKADSEFTVELTINKGTIGGFAKLQQELPEGFTAVQDENNGASFTFTDQSVKFVWLSLPTENEFKVKYKVKVAAGQSGDKIIGGIISYVSDNVKQSFEIPPSTITVGEVKSQPIATTTKLANTGTNTTEPANTNNTSTNQSVTSAETTSINEPTSIACIRSIPSNVSDTFTVEISINKGNSTGVARLLETLPLGFTASAGESQGGYFSFENQKVKIIWISMPSKSEFKISYKVTVAPTESSSQNIEGVFSYIENDKIKKIVIPTSRASIGESPIVSTTTNTDNTVTKTNASATNNTSTNNTTGNNTVANNTSTSNSDDTNSNTTKSFAATTIPSPQGNVYYRTQIAALRNPLTTSTLANKYNIRSKIITEMADGFTKYTTGSFNDYKSARDGREELKNKGIVSPFVTAYNGGKRITVQEALMITTQKWFR